MSHVKLCIQKEIVVHGVPVVVDLDFKLTTEWVDHGIGAYEFWGAKGIDRQMGVEWEVEQLTINGVVLNYQDKELKDKLEWWMALIDDQLSEEITDRVDRDLRSQGPEEPDYDPREEK